MGIRRETLTSRGTVIATFKPIDSRVCGQIGYQSLTTHNDKGNSPPETKPRDRGNDDDERKHETGQTKIEGE